MQPTSGDTRVVSAPSLILHGRTEIKARALVLGEVSALSFCHLTKEAPTSLATRRHKRHKIIKHLLLCFLCLFVAKSTSCFLVFVAQFASPILTRCPPMTNRKRKLFVFCLMVSFMIAGLPTSHADTFRPVVRGKRGAVAGGSPLSVDAGLRMLQRGGNAVDAGVATILAASVIEFSHFSFGGEVPILIKLKGQKVAVVEGMGQAPMKATREFFVNAAASDGAYTSAPSTVRRPGMIPSTGPLAATVPAVLDACVT